MVDTEIMALQKCTEALEPLEDAACKRVIAFLNNRYSFSSPPTKEPTNNLRSATQQSLSDANQIPGIALRGPDGGVKITARDLKAKSANDAAVRLAHIALLAHAELTGEQWASAKGTLVPLLKAWRVYDGNTRGAIAAEKGIVRNGDKISLDVHAEQQARVYISDVLDEKVKGSWTPNGRKRIGKPK
jgi:hypothetical protein